MCTQIKALEQLGQHRQALTEVQLLNQTSAANDDTRAMEKRLREAVGGKVTRPASATPAAPSRQQAQPQGQALQLTIKATRGNDSRLVTTPFTVTYPALMSAIKSKFPDSGVCAPGSAPSSEMQLPLCQGLHAHTLCCAVPGSTCWMSSLWGLGERAS